MSLIKIKLGTRDFELACPENSQAHIYSLAEKLNMQIKKFQDNNPSSSFDLAMVITALNLIEARDNVSQEQLGENLEDAIAIASKQAADKARNDADQEISSVRLELEKAKTEITRLKAEIQENSLESSEKMDEIYNHLQQLSSKL